MNDKAIYHILTIFKYSMPKVLDTTIKLLFTMFIIDVFIIMVAELQFTKFIIANKLEHNKLINKLVTAIVNALPFLFFKAFKQNADKELGVPHINVNARDGVLSSK